MLRLRSIGWFALPLLLAVAVFLFNPIVYLGGGSDDQRYIDAARAWAMHGPVVGRLHWDLRYPVVLPVAAVTGWLGEGRAALLLVPIGYALALLAVGLVLVRDLFDARVAAIWGVVVATNPLIHELATRIYPDLAEAVFVIGSIAACRFAARYADARRVVLLLSAGLLASLAILTRETSLVLPIVYALAFLAGRPLGRRDWLIVGVGAVPVLAIETATLWAATGDPLYRFHVALHHVDVPSNHMAGKVFTGPVLFNPALAQRWVVDGPVDVHWTVNPLIYFVLSPYYGGAFVAPLLLWVVAALRRVRIEPLRRRSLRWVALYATASFVFVTYVLMISQRPRYYVVPLLAVLLTSAVLADRLMPVARRWVVAILAVQIVASLTIIGVRHPTDRGLPPPVVVAVRQ